jgi:hypothetical protein
MSRTVYLHVGLAKSGTTYLQHILQANRDSLEEHGVLFPGPKMSEHFKAALDLSGTAVGGEQPEGTSGAWLRLVEAVNAYPGRAVVSHEMFALATREQIGRAVSSFETTDVRLVVTARDFGRQVPAVWQERIKNGSQERYADFLESIFDSELGRQRRGGFWRMQHLVDVCDRWAEPVGAGRLTVVTVPPAGAEAGELWRRFSRAIDLPELDYQFDTGARNPSLGVVESELVRRLNGRLPDLERPQYVRRVKRRFAEGTLAAASTSARLAVPATYRDEVTRVSEAAIDHLTGMGCRVVGDLAELMPAYHDTDPASPDDVAEGEVLDLALAQLGDQLSRPPSRAPAEPAPASAPSRSRGRLRSVRDKLTRS